MAFITITSVEKSINLDMGVYGAHLDAFEYLINKSDLKRLIRRVGFIEVWIDGVREPFLFHFETNTSAALIIQSIDGEPIQSLIDLQNKLKILKTAIL